MSHIDPHTNEFTQLLKQWAKTKTPKVDPRHREALTNFVNWCAVNGAGTPTQILPNDRKPLKADMISRHARADCMLVILGNRAIRPCQTLTILLHQSPAHLGTKAS
jgi:hypothetical protein